MGASGTAIVDFGAFPGQSEASVTITAPGIATGSLVEAWIFPIATADHTADEHRLETLEVVADPSTIVANTSFVVYVTNTSQLNEPTTIQGYQDGLAVGGLGTRIWGKWQIGWVWN